jgi:hypothetical protein
MADFSLGSYGTGHLTVSQNWNSSTQVSYHIRLWATTTGGWYDYGPGPNWNGNAGGVGGSGGWSYTGNGDHNLWEFNHTYNKNANGYGTWNFYGYINGNNGSAVGAGSTSFNVSPARIGVAPGIAGVTADSIKPTSARLGGDITDYGLGTSATLQMFIRLQGAGSWTDLGTQGNVAGYNYWNPSGLKPGKTYEYFLRVWNNNGDTANSGINTFKTQPVSGMIAVMRGLL